MPNTKEILKKVDHTLLSQAATWKDIKTVLDDAVKYDTASAYIPPAYVKQAVEYLKETGSSLPVCTVIGFPNGYNTTEVKVYETKDAIKNGASEIDMVINIGMLKDKRHDDIEKEIRAIHEACDVCAVNTSRLAYDGSGKVLRGKDAGFNTYELCKFTTGKVYNCDLSASKNIGARFFIRVLLKSLSVKEELLVLAKVPELNRRTSCCLATLINAYAVLRTFKAKSEAPAEDDAA